ncbi:MAG: hypothetical protein IKB13_05015 [Clostridia bacterium]|nr:hypothetical protein [Clostridia bacterium]
MKRLTAVAIVLVCLLCFSACTGNTIGKISGAENELIIIDDVTYIREHNSGYSNADKGKYLGKVSNTNITMKVYTVKGDSETEYIYTLWNWEGAFYKKEQP